VASSCGDGYEHSGSINGKEVLDQLSKEDCFMKLIPCCKNKNTVKAREYKLNFIIKQDATVLYSCISETVVAQSIQ
jgi:hypothetical protein